MTRKGSEVRVLYGPLLCHGTRTCLRGVSMVPRGAWLKLDALTHPSRTLVGWTRLRSSLRWPSCSHTGCRRTRDDACARRGSCRQGWRRSRFRWRLGGACAVTTRVKGHLPGGTRRRRLSRTVPTKATCRETAARRAAHRTLLLLTRFT